MRQIILLRHAKAEPSHPGRDDHNRPLALKGWDDAPRTTRRMIAQGFRPDMVLCSTARRCRETVEAAEEVLSGSSIEFRAELYHASPQTLWDTARAASGRTSHASVMLVAHNPGLRELATKLTPMGAPLADELRTSFPTASIAVFNADDDSTTGWNLSLFIRTKDLENLGSV